MAFFPQQIINLLRVVIWTYSFFLVYFFITKQYIQISVETEENIKTLMQLY